VIKSGILGAGVKLKYFLTNNDVALGY